MSKTCVCISHNNGGGYFVFHRANVYFCTVMTEDYPIPAWAETMPCAITVCDSRCRILFMNERARLTYASHGNLIGRNLLDCHGQRARAIIDRLLTEGGTNAYTVTKGGVHKVIYQCAWRQSADGPVAGLVELSLPVPAEMPHYDRDNS